MSLSPACTGLRRTTERSARCPRKEPRFIHSTEIARLTVRSGGGTARCQSVVALAVATVPATASALSARSDVTPFIHRADGRAARPAADRKMICDV